MIRPGEPNDYAAEILFYLPLASDPLSPKLGHVFTLGEVRIKLTPASSWINVALVNIVERGHGWYAIRLTTAQRAAAGVIAYEAVCAGAQPDRGTETLDDELGGDIAEGGSGLIPFFLADETDPIYGTPLEGHTFTLGEVELGLPDDAFGDVDPTTGIVEIGGGLYGVLVADPQTAKRGKAIVVADVAGAQRFSGYRTILGDGSGSSVTPPVLAPPSETTADGATADAAGDLALSWSNTSGDADVSLVSVDASLAAADLATDRGLRTAVILSLFTDRRAEPDDVPPSGDPRDRRGWWADQFAAVEGDRIGSRLWLLDRSTRTNEVVLRAKEYAREALAWMLEDRVAASVDVEVESAGSALLFAVGLQRPGRDPVTFRFAHTWDHLQESA